MRNNCCAIYIITNSNNNKVYVGQTWEDLNRRFYKHKSRSGCLKLKRAMDKYGVDTFSIETVGMASSQENTNYLEIYFIEYFDSIENGYNIKGGGSNGKLNEESKKKISVSNTGKIRTQEAKDKISIACVGMRNNTILDAILAKQIREEYATGQWTYKRLAQKYGVEKATIGMLIRGKTWKP